MKTLRIVILGLILGFPLGCITDPDLTAKQDLMAIGLHYHWFMDEKGRAPMNEEELSSFENPYSDQTRYREVRVPAALASGKYVVVWNADLLSDPSSLQDRILAYEKDVPQEGGIACFQNTMIERITREAFTEAMARTKENVVETTK